MNAPTARWILVALALAALSAACMPPAPEEVDLGAAKRAAELRQTQNPQRSDVSAPVDGLPATTAAEVLENYHTNQKTEVQERRQERQRDSGISEIGED